MKRPWQVWLMFMACALGAAAAMAWLTRQALQADRARSVAEAEAELEQRVSLALWRMDTALAPIIAAEVIRPPSAYRPGAAAVPPPPYVLLQFEAAPDSLWRTPQAPATQSREMPRLAELRQSVDILQLLASLPNAPLPTAADVHHNLAANQAQTTVAPNAAPNPYQFFEGNTANRSEQINLPPQEQTAGKGKLSYSKAADFEKRGEFYQSAARQSLLNTQQVQQQVQQPAVPPNADSLFQSADDVFGSDASVEQIGVSRPLWVGERLLLARRVETSGGNVVQGSWLDWDEIEPRLLSEASDLVSQADLVPVNGKATTTDPGRMLAGLPVRLVVNESAVASGVGTPLQWALWTGWGAVLLATLAAAALLHGVMTLSERRAAFVSSVTHELRTPLTTFRIYAEMLARGMVPDAARRQDYFDTLQREAERLTLLVENVLAYARLERGRKPQASERITIDALLDRVGSRLRQRADQAEMQCDLQVDASAGGHEFTTDLNVVEQILFNLVDNAAKYARAAADPRIHVEVDRSGQWLQLAVRDHGPGIERRPLSRRTRPFGKSAQESAESAPGVGLGLALCGRLARQLGGRLEIDTTPGGGATVTLLLPAC